MAPDFDEWFAQRFHAVTEGGSITGAMIASYREIAYDAFQAGIQFEQNPTDERSDWTPQNDE